MPPLRRLLTLGLLLACTAVSAAALPAAAAPTAVKVATYNLRYNAGTDCEPSSQPNEAFWPVRKPLIVRHILDPNLDGSTADMIEVLGIQEAKDGDTCQTPEPMWADLRDDLSAASGQPWAVADADNESSGHNRILYNSALYSVVDAGAVRLAAQVPGEFSRFLTWAILTQTATQKQFLFTTTHLSPGSPCGAKAQWAETIVLAGQLSGGRPVISTGDYNLSRDRVARFDCKAAKMFKFTKRTGLGDTLDQRMGTYKPGRRAGATYQQWLGSSNSWNPSTRRWGYPRKHKRLGKAMIDHIFASRYLPVYLWGNSADVTPDGLWLEGTIPSDHNMIFAVIGLP